MPSNSPSAEFVIDEQRLMWRKRLPEMVCRELAADYISALGGRDFVYPQSKRVDMALADAYDEYMETYEPLDRIDRRSIRGNKKVPKRRNRRAK